PPQQVHRDGLGGDVREAQLDRHRFAGRGVGRRVEREAEGIADQAHGISFGPGSARGPCVRIDTVRIGGRAVRPYAGGLLSPFRLTGGGSERQRQREAGHPRRDAPGAPHGDATAPGRCPAPQRYVPHRQGVNAPSPCSTCEVGLDTNRSRVLLPPHRIPKSVTELPLPDQPKTGEPLSPPPTPAWTRDWHSSLMFEPETFTFTHVFVIGP